MAYLLALQKAAELYNKFSKHKPVLKKAAAASALIGGIQLVLW